MSHTLDMNARDRSAEHAEVAELLDRNRQRLARIARQYAGEAARPDLLQEMSIAIWQSLPKFRGDASIDTFVYRVALNTALTFRRGHQRRQVDQVDVASEPLAADADTPLSLLDHFLASLDPINRAVLLMDLEGLDRDTIANVLGFSAGAVAVRMTRLKQRFEDEYLESAS